jgi:hypothetical protein
MTKGEIVIAKVTSGKFWLSIIAGIVFAYATYSKILSGEAVSAIISMVFVSYFTKDKGNGNPTP